MIGVLLAALGCEPRSILLEVEKLVALRGRHRPAVACSPRVALASPSQLPSFSFAAATCAVARSRFAALPALFADRRVGHSLGGAALS
jgi:hypothetical protein